MSLYLRTMKGHPMTELVPTYLVVVNGEEQYSIWAQDMPQVWTDMRPASLRQAG